jgi:hypothetical protein
MDRELDVRGVWVRGDTPKELVLSDGSRLRLQPAELGRVEWMRTDELRGGEERMSTVRARELAGAEYADYVTVRTRAEAEWLRAVAEWCGGEATRLEGELA